MIIVTTLYALIALIFPVPFLLTSIGLTVYLKGKQQIFLLFLTCIQIGYIGLFFVPTPDMDASRHLQVLVDISNSPNIQYVFQILKLKYSEYLRFPIFSLMLYYFGKFPVSGVINALALFISSFFTTLPLVVFFQKHAISFITRFLLVISTLVSINILYTLSGMRWPMAVGLSFSVMMWILNSNTKVFIKYLKFAAFLVPYLIHPGVLPLIAIFIFAQFFGHLSMKSTVIIVFISLVAIPAFYFIANSLLPGTVEYFFSKFSLYQTSVESDLSSIDHLIRLIVGGVLSLIFLIVNRFLHVDSKSQAWLDLSDYVYLLNLAALVIAPRISDRFLSLVFPILILSFAIYIDSKLYQFSSRNIWYYLCIFFFVFSGAMYNLHAKDVPLSTSMTSVVLKPSYLQNYKRGI